MMLRSRPVLTATLMGLPYPAAAAAIGLALTRGLPERMPLEYTVGGTERTFHLPTALLALGPAAEALGILILFCLGAGLFSRVRQGRIGLADRLLLTGTVGSVALAAGVGTVRFGIRAGALDREGCYPPLSCSCSSRW